MIAFDIDGLLVNDLNCTEYPHLDWRYNVSPFIQWTKTDYYLISGRPATIDYEETCAWVEKYFIKKPKNIYLFDGEWNGFDIEISTNFKASLLDELDEVKIYVESCPKQTELITQKVQRWDVCVIHMETLINESLISLLGDRI